jgi:hypothetical protein
MTNRTRRSVLSGSLALAAAGTLARPYVANAEAATATAWWVQAHESPHFFTSRYGGP